MYNFLSIGFPKINLGFPDKLSDGHLCVFHSPLYLSLCLSLSVVCRSGVVRGCAGRAGGARRDRGRKIKEAQEGVGFKLIAGAADGGVEGAALALQDLPIGLAADGTIEFAGDCEQGVAPDLGFEPTRVHPPE